jgi:hypothetical protein
MRQPLPVFVLGCLLAAGGGLSAAGPAPQPQSKLESAPSTGSQAVSPPLPIGVEADVYCTGWLQDDPDEFPATIVSAELVDSKDSFFQGDIVYLGAGATSGIAAGQEYWIVRPGRTVFRWGSITEAVGHIDNTPGRLRILCAQEETAIGEIVLSCSDIRIGDAVLPFEPIPIPLVRRTVPLTSCDPVTGKVTGHIVDTYDHGTPIATTTVVYLDVGELDGVMPGDFFAVYRYPTNVTTQVALGEVGAAPTTSAYDSIRTMLGEAAILSTRKTTSVAIITSMRDTMYAGDRIEMK